MSSPEPIVGWKAFLIDRDEGQLCLPKSKLSDKAFVPDEEVSADDYCGGHFVVFEHQADAIHEMCHVAIAYVVLPVTLYDWVPERLVGRRRPSYTGFMAKRMRIHDSLEHRRQSMDAVIAAHPERFGNGEASPGARHAYACRLGLAEASPS